MTSNKKTTHNNPDIRRTFSSKGTAFKVPVNLSKDQISKIFNKLNVGITDFNTLIVKRTTRKGKIKKWKKVCVLNDVELRNPATTLQEMTANMSSENLKEYKDRFLAIAEEISKIEKQSEQIDENTYNTQTNYKTSEDNSTYDDEIEIETESEKTDNTSNS